MDFQEGPFRGKIFAKNKIERNTRRKELKSEVNESGVSCVSTSLHQFSDCFCVFEIEVMSARVRRERVGARNVHT